jgi:Protein of unknown function (DUF1631)
MHFAGLLEQSRDLICDRLEKALDSMLLKSKDTLASQIQGTRNFEERRLYEEVQAIVMGQREAMAKQFRASYVGEFRRRSDRTRKIGQTSVLDDDAMDRLELVGEDDYEETLKFNSMAAKLRAYCDEELVALDQRVGVLLGDATLQANDNPFSPQAICDAYKHVCRHVDAGAPVRRLLLKLFDDHVLDDIRSMYKAVNGLLVENSILPRIRYSVSRSQDRRASGAGGSADPNAPDITTGVAQDLFGILQNLAARGGMVGTGPQPGVVVLQGAELQNSLTRIQHGDLGGVAGGNLTAVSGAPITTNINVLRELKDSSVGAGMGSLDLMTLDIIAMLFDQLFDDPKVPNGVKGLIGRLQIPMLKVAIADKSFFATKTHPARRLLDTLGDVAWQLPADFSPDHRLFVPLQNILEEVVQGFTDNLEIFTNARERVDKLLVEENQRIEEESQEAARAAAKLVEEQEKLAVAKRAAEMEVKARVQIKKVPRPVLDFLVQQWLKLLLLLHVKEGKESEAWKGAVEVMDLLIWSIEPKPTREERSKLIGVIPVLIKKLAQGLNTAEIGDEVRTQFLGELMKFHRELITAPVEGGPDSAPAAQGASPMQAKAIPAPPPDFSTPVTVKNPFGEGDVNVDSLDLDFTTLEPTATTPPRGAPAENTALANLTVGTWVAFRDVSNHPERRPAKLIFVTPRKTRYLFAFDRAGKDILPFTPGEMARRFRVGDATIIEEPRAESLFDRIMKGLVGKLRAAPAT